MAIVEQIFCGIRSIARCLSYYVRANNITGVSCIIATVRLFNEHLRITGMVICINQVISVDIIALRERKGVRSIFLLTNSTYSNLPIHFTHRIFDEQ